MRDRQPLKFLNERLTIEREERFLILQPFWFLVERELNKGAQIEKMAFSQFLNLIYV